MWSLLLALQLAGPQAPASPLERLQRKIAVEALPASSPSQLAGHYTSASSELGKRIGGFLTGEDLYLFADSTYLYCEWGDIEPLTIYDKGKWLVSGGRLTLSSDADITWPLRRESRYLLFRRAGRPQEALLIGLKEQVAYFEKQAASDDPEAMLLIVSLVREKVYSPSEGRRLKAQLMADAWRPERHGK